MPRTIIGVRKYTIRYTSYGPPRDKLHFILGKLDWLRLEQEDILSVHIEELKPLYRSEPIGAILWQPRETRGLADGRCFSSLTRPEIDKAAMAEATDEGESAPVGEGMPQTQMPHTQLAFGTQLAHPIRARPKQDDAQFLGINRMEPVLAGDTQREEIRPAAASSDYETRMKLLGLLSKGQARTKSDSPTKGFIRGAFSKPENTVGPRLSETPDRVTGPNQQSTSAGAETRLTDYTSPASLRATKQVRDIELTSPVTSKTADKHSPTQQVANQPESEDDLTLAMKCSWMEGFTFDRESLQVSSEQQRVLVNKESWYKPQPGVIPFADGNMPIRIFKELGRLADEKAAAESDPCTDSEMDIDPSPESDHEAIDASAESLLEVTQEDDLATSQVSWSATPSPEPPEKPVRAYQGLPPDSSVEVEVPQAKSNIAHQATTLKQQSQSPAYTNLLTEKEPSVPSSSPPLPQLPADSDEEMEMETSVPQALGEDAVEEARHPEVSNNLPGLASPIPKPVVQVKETPYAKEKNSQTTSFQDSPPKPEQDSSGNSESILSTSIVYGTYNEQDSSGFLKDVEQQGHITKKIDSILENHLRYNKSQRGQGLQTKTEKEGRRRTPERARDATSPAAQPESTAKSTEASELVLILPKAQPLPMGATMPEQPRPTSALRKRKLADSPSKIEKRPTKRREIKIVGFGNHSPSTTDPISALRQDREESLRKFREERRPSTDIENRSSSIKELDVQQDAVTMEGVPPYIQTSNSSSHTLSPRHKSLYEEPDLSARPSTVFGSFKAAYPQYTGGVKHFGTLCKQMYELELEDKMVPKWQWDDFIMRNRTDYKNYAIDCADRGENPEPYYRFYKDTIRNTLYKRSVIDSKATLLKALEELDVQPSVRKPPMVARESPRKNKRPRTSLPDAFHQYRMAVRNSIDGTQDDRPRHSLPAHSHKDLQTPEQSLPYHKTHSPARSASKCKAASARAIKKTNLLQHLGSDDMSSARITPENTGDPFRDYVFAAQRTKSWTGSSNVSDTKR